MAHDSHGTGLSALVKALIVVACIGALNWGLIGFFNWNLVDAIFGGGTQEQTSTASRVVYALVSLWRPCSRYRASPLRRITTSSPRRTRVELTARPRRGGTSLVCPRNGQASQLTRPEIRRNAAV